MFSRLILPTIVIVCCALSSAQDASLSADVNKDLLAEWNNPVLVQQCMNALSILTGTGDRKALIDAAVKTLSQGVDQLPGKHIELAGKLLDLPHLLATAGQKPASDDVTAALIKSLTADIGDLYESNPGPQSGKPPGLDKVNDLYLKGQYLKALYELLVIKLAALQKDPAWQPYQAALDALKQAQTELADAQQARPPIQQAARQARDQADRAGPPAKGELDAAQSANDTAAALKITAQGELAAADKQVEDHPKDRSLKTSADAKRQDFRDASAAADSAARSLQRALRVKYSADSLDARAKALEADADKAQTKLENAQNGVPAKQADVLKTTRAASDLLAKLGPYRIIYGLDPNDLLLIVHQIYR